MFWCLYLKNFKYLESFQIAHINLLCKFFFLHLILGILSYLPDIKLSSASSSMGFSRGWDGYWFSSTAIFRLYLVQLMKLVFFFHLSQSSRKRLLGSENHSGDRLGF